MTAQVDAIDVFLYDEPVGRLEQDRHSAVFWFLDSYLIAEPRYVVGQYFETRLGKALFRGKRNSLPGFFANLVPEPGSKVRRMLCRANGIDETDDLSLLAMLGGDLHGAVTARPTTATGVPKYAVVSPPKGGLRFSLPGYQLKFSMSRDDNRFTLPAFGERGEWIVKVTGAGYPEAAQNEHGVMQFGRACGFEVPETEVIPVSDLPELPDLPESVGFAYAVRRYDRVDGGRLHQEDFAQVVGLHPGQKDAASYAQLGGWVSDILGAHGLQEFIRRFIFMVVSGNGDAHLKNWSLLYRSRFTPDWSPLYDQVATVAWGDSSPAMKTGGASRWSELTPATMDWFLRKLASTTTLAEVNALARTFMDVWVGRVDRWGVPPAHVEAIERHWAATPFLQELT